MLVLGQILWIFLLLWIDLFLPQGCEAAINAKRIWKKNDVDIQLKYAFKPARRLLDWRDRDEPSWRKSSFSSSSDNTLPLFIIIVVIVFVVAALFKCCMYMANQSEEENRGLTVHPPPRYSTPAFATAPATRRFLTPPMTNSRSLILLPEEHIVPIFIGIENPNYDPTLVNVSDHRTNASVSDSERRPSNPTPLLDLPPAYESVVKTDTNNAELGRALNISYCSQVDSEASSLPKYEDMHNK